MGTLFVPGALPWAATALTAIKDDGSSWLTLSYKDYLQWLDSRELARNTRRAYSSRVRQFLMYEQSSRDCQVADRSAAYLESAVEGYLCHLADQEGCRPATINAVLSAIEDFLSFLGVRRTFKRVAAPRSVRRILAIHEAVKLFETSAAGPSHHHAIVSLCLFAGATPAECIAMLPSDVEVLSPNVVDVSIRSARGKVRKLRLTGRPAHAISSWLNERLGRRASYGGLFINNRGGSISSAGIDYIVRKTGWRSRLDLCARTLRNTYLVCPLNQVHSASEKAAQHLVCMCIVGEGISCRA